MATTTGIFNVTETNEPELHPLGTRAIDHYAGGKPDTCPLCAAMPSDYRTKSGHLALDPATGATILEPHARTYRDAGDGSCLTCQHPAGDHDRRWGEPGTPAYCLA